MKEGPDIALLGSLIGDPSRANMLSALMSGMALTAAELAAEAGVSAQTASTHLRKLEDAGLLHRRKQGRHSYFALADDNVAYVLEAMMGFAAHKGFMRTRPGPRDNAMRKARICYDHLAGETGVQIFDSLCAKRYLSEDTGVPLLTEAGRYFITDFGIDLDVLKHSRRPLCKPCLDWSARKSHLAGALGAALLARYIDLGWAKHLTGSRLIVFSPAGERELTNWLK